MLEPPGALQSYQTGDRVWLGFIRGEKRYPIVLGRIQMRGDGFENNAGNGTFISLTVKDKAILPKNTSIVGVDPNFDSLTKVANNLKYVTNFVNSQVQNAATTTNYIKFAQADTETIPSLGSMIMVRTDSKSSYAIGQTITVYLQPSTIKNATNDYTAINVNDSLTKLDGDWQIIATLTGAVFALRIK
jgi:hypothetical protein